MSRRVLAPLAPLLLLGTLRAQEPAAAPTVEELAAQLADVQKNADMVWTILCAALVFFMQAGFAMVETGFTRAKNAGNIMMKNLMDFCIGALAYWAVGFGIMFGAGNALLASSTAAPRVLRASHCWKSSTTVNMAGTMNRLISVDTTKPPITATPIGARKLGSPAQPSAIGAMPAVIAIVVITMGRARFEHESINESKRDMPWSRCAMIAYSTIKMEFFDTMPMSISRPIKELMARL